MRDTRGFIQGVASLALTAILVAGVPIFLITRLGWPFDDIINALTDQLASDATVVATLLTATLVIVAWAAWIQITWAIGVEAVALIQGRSAQRIPILPGFQQGAAQLVTSCALVVSSFTPAAPAVGAPITPHQPAHDITLQVVTDAPNNATDTAAARATSTAPEPRYTVTHGDTFWAIAERLLGDGLRWQEIRDLNLNRTMDDGTGPLAVAANDSMVVFPTATTTYTLTAVGTGGPVTSQVTVTMGGIPPVTIDSFTADASSIPVGGSCTLSWATSNATSCTLDDGSGPVAVAAADSMVVSPTTDTTYTLTAQGVGGPVTSQVTVTVTSTPPPPPPPPGGGGGGCSPSGSGDALAWLLPLALAVFALRRRSAMA